MNIPVKTNPIIPTYDKYNYGSADTAKIVDFGTQPNSIFTSESLFHDRILQEQLAAEGWKLREHRYRNGYDMIPYTDGRLDVMVLGDIPALVAIDKYKIGIFAVCRQGYNTIIANRRLTPSELKGLRVGYSPNTTAHFTLDSALQSVNLTINDIISVPMTPDVMEAALHNHKVDAIVSWEPTSSRILTIKSYSAISTSYGFSYIAINLDFAASHPNLQKAILSAVVRATKWARLNEENIRTNLLWDRKAAIIFFGYSPVEANAKWINLLRKETIDNPSFPMLPLNFNDEEGLLHQQFKFLKKNNILPISAEWKKNSDRFNIQFLPEVIKESKIWQIDSFDYATEKLYQEKESVQ